MKKLTFIILAALAFAFPSCVMDEEYVSGNDQEVNITISTDTRAPGSVQFDAKDFDISTLRVIGYRVSDGAQAFNKLVVAFTDTTDPLDPENILRAAEVIVKRGTFNFVFIANETAGLVSDTRLLTYNGLKQITLDYTDFSASKNIPMIAFYDNVQVIDDYTLNNNGTPVSGKWKIGIDRLAVRADIELTLTATQYAKWTTWKTGTSENKYLLTINNIPSKVYLGPEIDNSSATKVSASYEARTGNGTYSLAPGNIVLESSGDYTITYPRIILPESYFTDKTTAAKAMSLAISFSDGSAVKSYTGVFGASVNTSPYDYTLPRNSYVGVKASVKDDVGMTIQATVEDWNEANMKTTIVNGNYWVSISARDLTLDYTAQTDDSIEVTTNVQSGWSVAGIYDDAACTTSTTVAWVTSATKSGNNLAVTVIENNDVDRIAYVKLQAGMVDFTVKVTQIEGVPIPPITVPGIGDPVPSLTHPYVGVFWKADQIGERIIKIPVDGTCEGKWSVQVYEYGNDFQEGDIVFSTDPSSDTGITWNAATEAPADMIANDGVYTVTGNALFAQGEISATGGEIFFRIGLTSKWSDQSGYDPDTKPARYATIIIGHQNNEHWQKLYLRQGHEADYLMRDGDVGINTLTTGYRPYAKRFSPYNLTAPQYKPGNAVYVGDSFVGTNGADHATIPARSSLTLADAPDYFTDYPTQAGAFFQWGGASTAVERKAYHPTIPMSILTGWNSNNVTGYWSTLATANETCPPGWRRPTDGSTSTGVGTTNNISDSEYRQSLYLNPQNGMTNELANTVFGYYADGFFDRREIVTSLNNETGTVVQPSSMTPAYSGRLLFNPYNNASLFLISSGYRDGGGGLQLSGEAHYAWSSSVYATDTGHAWAHDYRQAWQFLAPSAKSNGFGVKCVKE